MDLVHFEEEEKKTCHGFIAFWGVFNNKSLKIKIWI